MPSELTADVVLTNPSGSLTIGGTPRELIAVGVSGRSWRRRIVEGAYQHGRTLVGAVLATPTLTVIVRCTGATWADVATQRRLVEAATSHLAYTAAVTLAGATDTYDCEPADITYLDGPTLDGWHVRACVQDLTLQIPIRPV